MTDFSKTKKVHFIGIGGIGISAIARMFLRRAQDKSLPMKVSGSDMAESEMTKGLQEAGATIFIGEDAKHIPPDCDLVIYTIAISDGHPELVEAKKRGIPILSYPEALGIVSKDKYTIAVTGTHGKTTTTAMIARVLMDAGLDPTVIIGSLLLTEPKRNENTEPTRTTFASQNLNGQARTNFVAGKGKYLVVEGCEYRRSFLNLSPKILVITNIDNDHLDYYKDLDDIESAFSELSAKVPKDGAIVCDFADKRAKRAAAAGKGRIIDFGEYLTHGPKLLVPGTHNKKNAATALAVSDFLGVDLAAAQKSLSEFKGTWRRFEFRGKARNGALVYDDYGHHPTEIKATLAGARELHPKERLVVVFQPHLYSRTKLLLHDFALAFSLADEIILAPIYPAREAPDSSISSKILVAEIRKNEPTKSVHYIEQFVDIEKYLRQSLKKGDTLITLGAGEANKISDWLVAA